MTIKSYFKNKLGIKRTLKILYKLRSLKSILHIFNLNKLALIHRTDKFGEHFYTQHYQNHLKRFQFKRIKLLEIGVGGYDDPLIGGNSLRMWKSYFPFGKIYALDIFEKSFLQESRIRIFKGSQIEKSIFAKISKEVDEFDVIIDDGSHINEHVIKSFQLYFPKLKNGGIYVIEDTQTSYWPNMGGELLERNNENTIYGYFKNLIDGLNYNEFMLENYRPTYFDLKIVSIHFYHNLIFIYKNENNEKSNVIVNGKRKF